MTDATDVTPEWTPAKVCSWCGAHIGGPKPVEGQEITHTICPACKARALKDLEDDHE